MKLLHKWQKDRYIKKAIFHVIRYKIYWHRLVISRQFRILQSGFYTHPTADHMVYGCGAKYAMKDIYYKLYIPHKSSVKKSKYMSDIEILRKNTHYAVSKKKCHVNGW